MVGLQLVHSGGLHLRPKQVIVLCSLAKLSGQPTEMPEGGGGIVMGWYLIQVEYQYF